MTWWLVRHAKAGNRSRWEGDDRMRPLSAAGHGQAEELARRLPGLGELPDHHPPILLSSPANRCIQTLAPYADTVGATVEVVEWLFEDTPVPEVLAGLAAHFDQPVVACSHGDVIPGVLRHLADRGALGGGGFACPKASAWVVTTIDGTATGASYQPPPTTSAELGRSRR